MTIVNLFEPPGGDTVLVGHVDDQTFYIAYVAGAGECPHRHRLEKQAEACGRKMRAWIDYRERISTSGVQADGTFAVYRPTPGPRPTRRPW